MILELIHTGTNNIHHATKNKNISFKNNNSNHDKTKTDKKQKQKLNSSTEGKIYCAKDYLCARTDHYGQQIYPSITRPQD